MTWEKLLELLKAGEGQPCMKDDVTFQLDDVKYNLDLHRSLVTGKLVFITEFTADDEDEV